MKSVNRRPRRPAWVYALLIPAFGLAAVAGAQEQRITGRVVDPDHAPVPSASVVVTGTTIGTNTSDSGTFTVRVPADGKSLTVRRIGRTRRSVILNL